MNKHVNYTWVGFFVVVFVTLIILTSVWLSVELGKEKHTHYLVYAKADVSGLSVASPVRFNGVQVGTVHSIDLDKNDSQAVIIEIEVQLGTPVTTSTVALVETEGVTGVQYIALKSLQARAPLLKKKPGQKYPVIPFEPSLFMRISSAVQLITGQMETLSESVQEVLSPKNVRAFSRTMANIQRVTKNLADDSEKIDSIIKSTAVLMHHTAVASKKFPKIVANANKVLKDLQKTTKTVRKTATKAAGVLNQASDVMNAATQQVIPGVTRFVSQLDQIGNNVSTITNDVKRNPSVMIRGKRPAPLGPGEE